MTRPEKPPNSSVQRICLVRPSALGDVCRTVPVAVSLRRAFPGARIEWIVQDTFVDAVRAHPAIDGVIAFPRNYFGRVGRGIAPTRDFLAWCRDLRRRRFDLVYDCQGLARSAFIAWLTGAPRRVGFADAREGGFIAYTDRHRIPADLHTVDRMLQLVALDGVEPATDMRLYTPEESVRWWQAERAAVAGERTARIAAAHAGENGRMRTAVGAADSAAEDGIMRPATPGAIPPGSGSGSAASSDASEAAVRAAFGRYAVFAPTSRWRSKRWPAASFAALVKPILDRGFDRLVIVGARGEEDQVGPLLACADGQRAISMLGRTTVGGMMAIVEQADLVLANDSAALHMAVGFDRPYVAFFGPTDIRRVGPYGGALWTLQETRPGERLHHKSDALGSSIMERISPAAALHKIDERLEAATSAAITRSE